jgi:hypothetical protein
MIQRVLLECSFDETGTIYDQYEGAFHVDTAKVFYSFRLAYSQVTGTRILVLYYTSFNVRFTRVALVIHLYDVF